MSIKKRSRREERILAFQFLYSLSYTTNTTVGELQDAFCAFLEELGEECSCVESDFCWQLVRGVWAKQAVLDETIQNYSHDWKVDRIGKAELCVLRIAIYELLYTQETAYKVIISEALTMVKGFGDTNANPFINGILDAVRTAKGVA